jgi:flagellin
MNINSSSVSTAALSQASQRVDRSNEQMSSGLRINSAADDAAGLAISTGLNSENRGQLQAIRNASDGISLTQTASGALKGITENLQRIRELSVQSANGSYSDQDRALLNKEAQGLLEQTASVLESANFNGNSLFGESNQSSYQVGPDSGDLLSVESNNLQQKTEQLGLGDINLSTQNGASQAIELSDALFAAVNETAVSYGALENRFESRISDLQEQSINSAESASRIQDVDYAKASSERSAALIQEQVGIAMQAQANKSAGNILKLLGG